MLGYQPKEEIVKYNEMTWGRMEAIINKLGGMEGVKRFLSGETDVSVAERRAFETWKTITVGSGPKTADVFRKAIKKAGNKISDWGNDILGQKAFTVASEETTIDLVKVTARDLGFTQNVTRREIYAKAIEMGLEILPAEVGPALRLAYQDQPMGEWILIGMEPITGSHRGPEMFGVKHREDGLWLYGGHGYPDDVWHPDDVWVFGRRK